VIRVLLVEDDQSLARLTAERLKADGLVVALAANGRQGLEEAESLRPDVVLLVARLPVVDHIELCRALRERSDVPIIILGENSEEAHRVIGLESGADDYLSEPFSSPELLARIRALTRRFRGAAGPNLDVIRVGDLVLEPSSLTAALSGQVLSLSSPEFALLKALAQRAGRVVTREQLLDLTGGGDEFFDRTIDVRISRLRHKLGDDPRQPRLLKTVRRAGYMFAA
jgi:DNA-binding response OmpR family regulator